MIKAKDITDLEINFEPHRSTYLVTTNKYFATNDLDFSDSQEPIFDENQFIVAAGEGCHFKVGDQIRLDLEEFVVHKKNPTNTNEVLSTLEFKSMEIDDNMYILVDDSRRFVKGKFTV